MTYNPDFHHRRSIRLRDYDYSSAGAYFVTVCVQNRECLFGEIVDGTMVLNDAGRMVELVWDGLSSRFSDVELDEFIVLPNHVHAILLMPDRRGESCIRPLLGIQDDNNERPHGTSEGSIGRIIQAFKSLTTHAYTTGVKQSNWPPFPGKLWQRNYYERIIRNEAELNGIREYIINNPINWADDEENHPIP